MKTSIILGRRMRAYCVALFCIAVLLSIGTSTIQAQMGWYNVASMGENRNHHSAITLNNGQVLVSGGVNSTGALSSCELYDPASNTWASTGSLNQVRLDHETILLQDGRVRGQPANPRLDEPL